MLLWRLFTCAFTKQEAAVQRQTSCFRTKMLALSSKVPFKNSDYFLPHSCVLNIIVAQEDAGIQAVSFSAFYIWLLLQLCVIVVEIHNKRLYLHTGPVFDIIIIVHVDTLRAGLPLHTL